MFSEFLGLLYRGFGAGFCTGEREGLHLVFCTWVSSFPSTVYRRGCFFFTVCLWYTLQNWLSIFLLFFFYFFFPLICESVFQVNTMPFGLVCLCNCLDIRYYDASKFCSRLLCKSRSFCFCVWTLGLFL